MDQIVQKINSLALELLGEEHALGLFPDIARMLSALRREMGAVAGWGEMGATATWVEQQAEGVGGPGSAFSSSRSLGGREEGSGAGAEFNTTIREADSRYHCYLR